MLLEKALKGISDDKLIKDQRGPAVKALLDGYMSIAGPIDTLPNITLENTGRELKNAVGKLWAQNQIVLLYQYLKDTKVIDDETIEEREDKKLERWIKKIGVISIVLFTAFGLVIVGGLLVFNHHTALAIDAKTQNSLIESFLEMAFEIVKLIFGIG